MIKFLITGHTQGIGKAIYQRFGGIGLSRSTGFDISKDDISPYLDECDVFINNAHCYDDIFAQTRLVYHAENKRQLVIGSLASDFSHVRTNSGKEYTTAKTALECACHQLFHKGSNITLIKPGYVNDENLSPSDIVDVIEWILLQDFSIKEITFKK